MGKGGNIARKAFHLVAASLFVAALVVMFKTFPAAKDGPTITRAERPPLQGSESGAAAAANKAIAENAGAAAAANVPEAGLPEGASAEQVKAAAAFSAAAKKALDDDPKVCHNNLLQDVDIFGHDVGSHRSASAEKCCLLCQDLPRCGAFTYVDGTCWFKGRVNMDVDQTNNIGAPPFASILSSSCSHVCATERRLTGGAPVSPHRWNIVGTSFGHRF